LQVKSLKFVGQLFYIRYIVLFDFKFDNSNTNLFAEKKTTLYD